MTQTVDNGSPAACGAGRGGGRSRTCALSKANSTLFGRQGGRARAAIGKHIKYDKRRGGAGRGGSRRTALRCVSCDPNMRWAGRPRASHRTASHRIAALGSESEGASVKAVSHGKMIRPTELNCPSSRDQRFPSRNVFSAQGKGNYPAPPKSGTIRITPEILLRTNCNSVL